MLLCKHIALYVDNVILREYERQEYISFSNFTGIFDQHLLGTI